MNTQNQRQRILELLRQSGNDGVNSYDLTFKFGVKQAPTRIRELKDEGLIIKSRRRRDKSVDYILLGEMGGSTVTTQPEIQPQKPWEEELVRVEKNGRVFWEPKSKFGQGGLGI